MIDAPTVRFATWNVELGAPSRRSHATDKLNFLRSLRRAGCDIVALQEVRMPLDGRGAGLASLAELAASGDFTHVLAPPLPRRRTTELGCVILVSERFHPVGSARRVSDVPAPERSCVVDLMTDDGGVVTVASIHFVAGADQVEKATGSVWGPKPKRQNFRAVARWMAGQGGRTIAGLDCNSPLVDHPELDHNVYHWNSVAGLPFDQEEHLLHDPEPSRFRVPSPYRHNLRDAFRVYLERDANARRRAAATYRRTEREGLGRGCLAVSHEKIRSGSPPWRRRFDFVFITPDIDPITVRYYPIARAREVGASHAPVVADLALRPAAPTISSGTL